MYFRTTLKNSFPCGGRTIDLFKNTQHYLSLSLLNDIISHISQPVKCRILYLFYCVCVDEFNLYLGFGNTYRNVHAIKINKSSLLKQSAGVWTLKHCLPITPRDSWPSYLSTLNLALAYLETLWIIILSAVYCFFVHTYILTMRYGLICNLCSHNTFFTGDILAGWQVLSFRPKSLWFTSQKGAFVSLQDCYLPFDLLPCLLLIIEVKQSLRKPSLSDTHGPLFPALHVGCITVVSVRIISLYFRGLNTLSFCIVLSLIYLVVITHIFKCPWSIHIKHRSVTFEF